MPPIVMGGALVIPRGLINRLMGQQPAQLFSQGDRKSIEMAAMRAVEEIERKLGYSPRDVSLEKCGYDIESKIPETLADGKSTLRFIEVKGRTVGATTVTVAITTGMIPAQPSVKPWKIGPANCRVLM